VRDWVEIHLKPIERTLWPGVTIPTHTDSVHPYNFTTAAPRALTPTHFNNFGALIKFLGGPAGQGQQLKDNMTRSGKFNQKHADSWSDYMKSVRYGGTNNTQKQLDKRHGGAGVTQKQVDKRFGGAGVTQYALDKRAHHGYGGPGITQKQVDKRFGGAGVTRDARGKQTRPYRYRPEP
jgi:hypothetical protein